MTQQGAVRTGKGHRMSRRFFLRLTRSYTSIMVTTLLLLTNVAHASPFDSGITNIQTLFTGTIAKAAALIAIVLGGWGFAFGDPGAKKNLAGVAMGSGIAVLAANVLTWLWGA